MLKNVYTLKPPEMIKKRIEALEVRFLQLHIFNRLSPNWSEMDHLKGSRVRPQ